MSSATEQPLRDSGSFDEQGYVILPRAVPPPLLDRVDELTAAWTSETAAPVELEVDVGYPGSEFPPANRAIRRFLQVYQRDEVFRRLLVESDIARSVEEQLGGAPRLVLAHHNCLMTKQPSGSSDTPWHRDLRYWSFERGELITAWIALGEEMPESGGLWIVPESHRRELPGEAYDASRAVRTTSEAGARATDAAQPVRLARGDVLLFHCRLLHRASRNHTNSVKRSLVFTFRREDDRPLPETRSAAGGEVDLFA